MEVVPETPGREPGLSEEKELSQSGESAAREGPVGRLSRAGLQLWKEIWIEMWIGDSLALDDNRSHGNG